MTRLYPGPLCTQLLATLGARVIKIEHPHRSDPTRTTPPFVDGVGAVFQALNFGKESLALNVFCEEGRETFLKLAKSADLVVEGFRPGVLKKARLDYEQVSQTNPAIIYVSITGYGQSGPYAQEAGHDINYIGYAGIPWVTGSDTPTLPGVQTADVAGGAYMAVIGATSALLSRHKTGKGQHVDVAMLDGVLPLMTFQLAGAWAQAKPTPRDQLMLSGGLACYGIYACGDGQHVALGALEPKFWKAFCDLVNKPEWIPRQFDQGDEKASLVREMQATFQTKSRDEWIELAKGRDVCLTPIHGPDEVLHNPHLLARETVIPASDSQPARIGSPIKFSHTPAHASDTSPKNLGAASRQILQSIGLDEKAMQDLRDQDVIG